MLTSCVWDGKNILGEGPLWDHRAQLLYWLDIVKAELHCLEPMTQQHRFWQMPEAICCIGLHSKGGLIAAWSKGFGMIDLADGKLTKLNVPSLELTGVMFNDGKVDRQGRFWAGTKDLKEQQPLGSLYQLGAKSQLQEMDQGFTVSNGLAWNLSNTLLYFTDSPARKIYQYDFDAKSGDISNRQVFATIANDAGYPDGLTIDSEGYIWSVHWGGWRVTRYKPSGEIDRVIEMPVEQPTSCCFGGKELTTLFVTSASRDLSAAQLARGPQAGAVFALTTDVKGLPEPLFRG